jgi:hypothetical protein
MRRTRAFGAYKAFTLRLAEQGFVTFAPHNPYRGMHAFRTLQRKLNPLGLTLYSVINGQHQRILEWLKDAALHAAGQDRLLRPQLRRQIRHAHARGAHGLLPEHLQRRLQ